MAKELPYLPSYKNVGALFEKIERARVPEAFTVRFLTDTIGLKSTGDRQLIPLLKKLGFLDTSGKPSPEYSRLKNKSTAKVAIAKGIRKAYAPLYEANEEAHDLPMDKLKGLVAQVSGAEEAMSKSIAYTFNALIKEADFAQEEKLEDDADAEDESEATEDPPTRKKKDAIDKSQSKYNPEFRFNIEIHLPSNGNEETYLAIFNALRKALG